MRVLFWGLIFFVFLASSCASNNFTKKKTNEKVVYFQIDKSIQNDRIKIYINEKVIYNNIVTVPENQSSRSILTIPRPQGTYFIKVEVNGKAIQQEILPFKEERKVTEDYIYQKVNYGFQISYDREKQEVKLDKMVEFDIEKAKIEL